MSSVLMQCCGDDPIGARFPNRPMVNIMLIHQNGLLEAAKVDACWLGALNQGLFKSPVLCCEHMFWTMSILAVLFVFFFDLVLVAGFRVFHKQLSDRFYKRCAIAFSFEALSTLILFLLPFEEWRHFSFTLLFDLQCIKGLMLWSAIRSLGFWLLTRALILWYTGGRIKAWMKSVAILQMGVRKVLRSIRLQKKTL